jgi:peroxiredoxin Q/BCP
MWFKLLPEGSPAPDFSLPDTAGQQVSLAGLRGRQVVLIFYPADFTPGCTAQLCAANAALETEALAEADAQILGINPASPTTHEAFAQRHHLRFPLLHDAAGRVAKSYRASLLPGLLNNRVVYGIDSAGIIRYAKMGAPPMSEVLLALQHTPR